MYVDTWVGRVWISDEVPHWKSYAGQQAYRALISRDRKTTTANWPMYRKSDVGD